MGGDPTSKARALIGTPFRLHGRDPEFGLDCVGLVAVAFDRKERIPQDYTLRGGDLAAFERLFRQLGCRRRRIKPRRNDILFVKPGPAQFHLGIWTGESLIHADAGLRRIVEAPGWPRWPVVSAWTASKGRG